jgi:putative ABC transport system substrate-binding protein
MIRRRTFIAGLGSAAAWPVVAQAQQAGDIANEATITAFLQGLKETGYVEGQNVVVEYRYVDNQYDRLPALAADLVRRVAVIVAVGVAAAQAAKAATKTIPIVFATGADPVASGLVASLNRPGGNVTGIANSNGELAPKRLQLLRQVIPNATRFGVLAGPAFPDTQSIIADLQAAARTPGLQLIVADAKNDSELEMAFATFRNRRLGGLRFPTVPSTTGA